MDANDLQKLIKDYPDFPQPGVIFRDISPILNDAAAFKASVDALTEIARTLDFDKIVAIDARGFLFGGALACSLDKGIVLCRKNSKLPGELVTAGYAYEYSSDSLSLQKASLQPGERVLIVDDVLATGSTFLAAKQLVDRLGGTVAALACLIELGYLNGRQTLEAQAAGTALHSVIKLSD